MFGRYKCWYCKKWFKAKENLHDKWDDMIQTVLEYKCPHCGGFIQKGRMFF